MKDINKIIEKALNNANELKFKNINTQLKKIIKKIWLNYDEMKIEISNEINKYFKFEDIIISGETNNISIYIILENNILIFSPMYDLKQNCLLKKWDSTWSNTINKTLHYYIFPKNKKLLKLLNFPKVLLINLAVVEKYPIPRLNLSTGSIAAYLRKKQCSEVSIIDMQMGYSQKYILNYILKFQPDIIGISINFGQKEISHDLLNRIYKIKITHKINFTTVVGNIIPSLYPDEFLKKYANIIVGYQEGEITFQDIIKYVNKDKEINLDKVRGILFINNNGTITKTPSEKVDMRFNVPTPALDTIQEISKLKGALTLETSRGCDYSNCTFCPREHKTNIWRALTSKEVIKQIKDISLVAKKFKMKQHIYIADEEFIGELPNGKEDVRIIEICKGIINIPYKIKFDASSRADSVYDPNKSKDWNVRRIKMWEYCQKANLDRIFIGVESGCDKQLKRFGKGTTAIQNIIALRILTALGINLRIGFLTFDQLMIDLNDLNENINFLEQKNVLMKKINLDELNLTHDELLDKLINDNNFINEYSRNIPVYSIVSYMLSTTEILLHTPYYKIVKNAEIKYGVELIKNGGKCDSNMGRYTVSFLNPLIGDLSLACQKWIDSNFSVMYAIKSLYKVSNKNERLLLNNYMFKYREISHYLSKYLVYIVDDSIYLDNSLLKYINDFPFIKKEFTGIKENNYKIMYALNSWQKVLKILFDNVRNSLKTNLITDTYDNKLNNVLEKWYLNQGTWNLINEIIIED